MIKKIKKELLKYTYYFPALQSWQDKKKQAADLEKWRKNPHPFMLPHLLKQEVLKKYAQEYHLSNLVETGTYLGEMVYALKDVFEKIYSIELSEQYAKRAQIYLRRQKHVKIIQGDSGDMVGELLREIDKPTLFWLDGHYSADDTAMGKKSTPILEELAHILRARDLKHVVLIDDAHDFGRAKDYPSLDELCSYIMTLCKNVEVTSKDDIIRILPV